MSRFVITFACGTRRVVRARDELHAREQATAIEAVRARSLSGSQAVIAFGR